MSIETHDIAGARGSRRGSVYVAAPGCVALAAMVASLTPLPPALSWNVAWTAAALSAFVAVMLARSRAEGSHRARWSVWAAAAGSWLVAQMAWDVFVIAGFPPSPNLADVGYWGFAALVIVSMTRVPGRTSAVRAVVTAESVPLIAAAIALTFAELWSDASHSTLALLPRISALVYPALYVSAAILTLQAIIGGPLRRDRSTPSLLILSGIVAQAVAFIVWSHQLLLRTNGPGRSWIDPLWVVGLIAIAAGGWLAARHPERDGVAHEPSVRGSILPALMLVAVLAALLHSALRHAPVGATITLAVGLLLCGLALIVRGALLERRLRALLGAERHARSDLARREAELARLNVQLTEDSRRDALTGLRNRRALTDDLAALHRIDPGSMARTAFALCDIDHFKLYNDHLGHLAGDQALRTIAATVRATLRAGDIAYRFGGEELLLVLRSTPPTDALAVAERVRRAVEQLGLPHPAGAGTTLTISIGVATGTGQIDTMLADADAALYEAKDAGRNRAMLARGTPGDAAPRPPATLPVEPVPRHLQSMLAISRASASGRGALPVLEALAATVRSELSFATVVVNLLDDAREKLRAVVVVAAPEVRRTLLDTLNSWEEWEQLMSSEYARCGAVWLPAGSYEWREDAPTWTPRIVPADDPDAWHPDDMLLLPLRATNGDILAVVSVDEPLSGRRPLDGELEVLMTVADHAGLALEQALRTTGEMPAPRERPDELLLAAVMLLAETVDLRAAGTMDHSHAVGGYARQTATELGIEPEQVERIHAAGVLHDLGKLGIADSVMCKPAALDPGERLEIQRHAEIGGRILDHAGLSDIATWVRGHHEWFDGAGYPLGLRAGEIALESRILAVADAYEAMTAGRPYRPPLDVPTARRELIRCAGTQFDPAVVSAFLRAVPDAAGEPAVAGAPAR